MRTAVTAALLVAAVTVTSSQRAAWTFEDDAPSRPPAGFVFSDAAAGQAPAWGVIRDGANALLLHAPHSRAGADVAAVEAAAPANLAVSVRLRFPDEADAAGIAWRYRDRDNYNAVVLDLRAQNVRIYRVAGGNRARLEDEDDLELDPGAWHTLKVEDVRMRIRVWINGVPVADARDRTRSDTGAAGVWAASDARVWFDDLRVESVREAARSNRRD